MTDTQLLLICGMHRSGTSLITKAFELFGFGLGDNLMAANTDNPKGFFEDLDVVALNNLILEASGAAWDIPPVALGKAVVWNADHIASGVSLLKTKLANSPQLAIKDPRVCLLLPFWQAVAKAADCPIKLCFVVRNPLDVAASLAKRNDFSQAQSLTLTHVHWQQMLQSASDHDLVVSYDALLDDPEHALARLGNWLSISPEAHKKRHF